MAVKRHRTHYDVTAENRTDQAMNAVERNMKKVDGAAAAMGRTFRNVVSATAAITLGREMARAAIEAEKSQNKLTAVLRATGGVAGWTRGEIEGLSQSLAGSTIFDDDAIRNAATQLAKFGNIQGAVFGEGLKLSTDLASFMGTEVPDAAQMIGRALQSPTEGLRLLEREFGRLTDAEEEHIDTLVAQGRAVEAQNAVLELLQRKIGGTAELMNSGLTKATAGVTEAWGDMLEAFGQSPAFQKTAESGLGFIEQSLKDIREIIEGGDWVEKTLAILAFAGGWRGFKLSRPAPQPGLAEAEAFEAGLRPAPRVTLGGSSKDKNKATRDAAAKRAAEFQEQLDVQAAMGSQLAADREAEYLKNLDRALGLQVDRLSLTHDEQQQVDQLAQKYQMLAEREAEFTDPTRLEAMLDSLKKVDQAAMDLGWAFSSAFEDAIIEGEKLRDVVQGLAKDVARIILRQHVTQPVATALAGAFGGLFGGMGASYSGSVPAFAMGTDSVPRTGLALVHRGEAIIPAGRNGAGGVTVNINMPFSANTPAAVRDAVMAAAPMLTEAAKRGVIDSKARGAG